MFYGTGVVIVAVCWRRTRPLKTLWTPEHSFQGETQASFSRQYPRVTLTNIAVQTTHMKKKRHYNTIWIGIGLRVQPYLRVLFNSRVYCSKGGKEVRWCFVEIPMSGRVWGHAPPVDF